MKKNKKIPKTSKQKEELFVNIGTRILLVITIVIAIVYSVLGIKNSLKDSDYKLLEELSKEVDTSQFLTDPIATQHETSLYTKLENSGLDLTEEGTVVYEKFNRTEIPISENITLTANEYAVLYNLIFLNSPDKYGIDLKQLQIEAIDGGYKIKSVCTFNLKSLITGLDGVPTRAYLINECEIKSGVITPLSTTYNNLSSSLSKTLTETINDSANVDMEKYVAKLLVKFSTNLATRTNCDIVVSGTNISFNLKTS